MNDNSSDCHPNSTPDDPDSGPLNRRPAIKWDTEIGDKGTLRSIQEYEGFQFAWTRIVACIWEYWEQHKEGPEFGHIEPALKSIVWQAGPETLPGETLLAKALATFNYHVPDSIEIKCELAKDAKWQDHWAEYQQQTQTKERARARVNGWSPGGKLQKELRPVITLKIPPLPEAGCKGESTRRLLAIADYNASAAIFPFTSS